MTTTFYPVQNTRLVVVSGISCSCSEIVIKVFENWEEGKVVTGISRFNGRGRLMRCAQDDKKLERRYDARRARMQYTSTCDGLIHSSNTMWRDARASLISTWISRSGAVRDVGEHNH